MNDNDIMDFIKSLSQNNTSAHRALSRITDLCDPKNDSNNESLELLLFKQKVVAAIIEEFGLNKKVM